MHRVARQELVLLGVFAVYLLDACKICAKLCESPTILLGSGTGSEQGEARSRGTRWHVNFTTLYMLHHHVTLYGPDTSTSQLEGNPDLGSLSRRDRRTFVERT